MNRPFLSFLALFGILFPLTFHFSSPYGFRIALSAFFCFVFFRPFRNLTRFQRRFPMSRYIDRVTPCALGPSTNCLAKLLAHTHLLWQPPLCAFVHPFVRFPITRLICFFALLLFPPSL